MDGIIKGMLKRLNLSEDDYDNKCFDKYARK